ncbi:MAG: SDR family oxidoreductase [Lachnospiraceae bacterium]|nr:SDR family oxidoreductase [Lachnospiraceae bacterium]
MKRTAIVTGASSGIGESISRLLCEMDYEVFGFGRNFEDSALKNETHFLEGFHPVECDLLDTESLLGEVKKIREGYEVFMLVNNAGVGYYGLHEELDPKKIQTMVRTNLEVPLLLTQVLLRDLKKWRGYVINISSVTAKKSNPHGCAYGAVKAGLSSFSESLFEETRKYGVKVIDIRPDMVKTNLYRNADFCEGEEKESYLLPEDVAEAVRNLLGMRDSIVPVEITLRPQLHRIRRKKIQKKQN